MGIEPTTLGLLDPRSNQLSYEGLHGISHKILCTHPLPVEKWMPTHEGKNETSLEKELSKWGSNPRPQD